MFQEEHEHICYPGLFCWELSGSKILSLIYCLHFCSYVVQEHKGLYHPPPSKKYFCYIFIYFMYIRFLLNYIYCILHILNFFSGIFLILTGWRSRDKLAAPLRRWPYCSALSVSFWSVLYALIRDVLRR